MRSIPLLLVALTGSLAAQPQSHWNQWRGPQRSGAFDGPTWPQRLSAETLQRSWRVELGPSYSGPIVDAERVFVTETVDKKEEVVRALDRETGNVVWSTDWKGAMAVPFFAARNGSWIRSTPAHDGKSLFVGGIRDVLVCMDSATGKERWRVDFVDRYEKGLPSFGMVCSPMVRGDHVYVQAGSSFCKLDKLTGETVWRTLEDGGGMMGGCFSSPVFATLAGREQLVVQTRSHLAGVDDENGNVLWSAPVRTFRGMNILTPLPWKDGVFTSAYGGRGHYFTVADAGDTPKGAEGDQEEVPETTGVTEAWQNRLQAYMTSPVIVGEHGYVYLRSKRFACFELATGEVSWISDPMGDTYWSIISQGERMLALTDDGELLLIAANPEKLEIVDRMTVAETSSWAHLAADGDQIFVRDLEGVTAFRWNSDVVENR